MQMKVCTHCHINKPITEFSPTYEKRCNSVGKTRADCKECRKVALNKRYPKHRDKICAYARKYRKANPDKIHHQNLMSRFGISYDDYKEMFKLQEYSCAICKSKNTTKKRFPVDHDHATGKIRAILCHPCNSAIGQFKESIQYLTQAIEYLRYHNEPNRSK